VQLDVVIYGASLALEFVALAVLRLKEPQVVRPFRVPGGFPGAVLVGILPMGLLLLSLVASAREEGGPPLVAVVAAVLAVGGAIYGVRVLRMRSE
jgi:amino acid transporter